MPRIHFLDVTNRDGVQTARTGLSKFGKTMVNFYLGKLGVAQSEIGFPFLFHEVPYLRAQLALAKAGAFGDLRLSGWCRAVAGDVEASLPLGLEHLNLSISTSDQMIVNKFRGRLDRAAVIEEMAGRDPDGQVGRRGRPSGSTPRTGRGPTTAFLTEFALAAKEAGADRVRYCDTIGGDTPGRIRERFAGLAARRRDARSRPTATTTWAWPWPTRSPARSATWTPARTPGSTPASTASASGPATPTCSPAILAFRHGFGLDGRIEIGDALDLTLGAAVRAVGGVRVRPAAAAQPARGRGQRVRPRVRHPRRRRAQGPRATTSCTTTRRSGRSRTTGTPAPGGSCSPASTAARPASATSWTASASSSPPATRTWCSSWSSSATPPPAGPSPTTSCACSPPGRASWPCSTRVSSARARPARATRGHRLPPELVGWSGRVSCSGRV